MNTTVYSPGSKFTNEYFPSTSVVVPFVVPSIKTWTPTNVSPLLSVTFPAIFPLVPAYKDEDERLTMVITNRLNNSLIFQKFKELKKIGPEKILIRL